MKKSQNLSATFMNDIPGLSYKCSKTGCCHVVAFVRSTQFSGDHFYCEQHAKIENDFKKEDSSYFFWSTIKDYEGNKHRMALEREMEITKREQERKDRVEQYQNGLAKISKKYKTTTIEVQEIFEAVRNLKNSL